ncbi:hypothetical protein TD95_004243 [Thielaviopsis punctulata]|uniref:Uncharacterized protein n=1 Tax=Thielaviopsis punctulata TaxID=72032 RepID=A0A0F4Z9F6_9PEZI|nr:hypothetical protein TD95_004243 [Thielaviopsis punctulata]
MRSVKSKARSISRLSVGASRHLSAGSLQSSSSTASQPASSNSSPPTLTPITSLLIANRGEIAVRIHRTAHRLGIRTTTLYTDPDVFAQHAALGSHSFNLGPATGYLDADKIIQLAKANGITAVHPGYGFLSENPSFAARCEDAGLVFVGPPAQAMADMGHKARSKEIMEASGVACVPGYHGPDQAPDALLAHALKVGFPVLLKSVRGGGGKGMRIVLDAHDFPAQLESARAEARASFGDGGEVMLVERYIQRPRHVEVQVFADKYGNCVALGERDCSVQRRHQKILEESPAPGLAEATRRDLWDTACRAAVAVGYVGAGTVEFIFDTDTGSFFFMEMNTRLQVEHPVSEMVTGTDLVEWQVRVAAGEKLPLTQDEIRHRIAQRGAAIEARIYAEKPEMGFLPDSGRLHHVRTPQTSDDVRIDAGFVQGDTISEAYDGMLAKLIVRGENRTMAIRKLQRALEEYEIVGLGTNIDFLKRVCANEAFVQGDVETGFVNKYADELFAERAVESEVFVQAALAQMESGLAHSGLGTGLGFAGSQTSVGQREFVFAVNNKEEKVKVQVVPVGLGRYDVSVYRNGQTETFGNLFCSTDTPASLTRSSSPTKITTHFPAQRISSTVVPSPTDPSALTVFQNTHKTLLHFSPPSWLAPALGVHEPAAGSVVAPMPCRILRVHVQPGQEVQKGQALVVIESMKMETVIKAPKEGVVKKLAHGEGELCKAGVVLVEFE